MFIKFDVKNRSNFNGIVTKTKNKVTSNAIRPGTTSGGIRKLVHETTTKSPLGR